MTDAPRDGWSSLKDAVARAIADNKALAGQTADAFLALSEALQPTQPPPPLAGTEAFADSPAELVLDAERALLAEVTSGLKDLAHQQLDAMDTFNIVLFGRTGAGKSSLLEALSHGDGGSISPGDSDWTTEVNPTDWAHCRVVDTPGIEGWGRTVSRAELERQARQELITADVVLLCFDSQSQKVGEFRKVADWIAEFRKPVVAVLNVRLSNWRFPTRTPRRVTRMRLSQTVADHAAHIHEVLSTIGLADTPIVAINTQRAVFARAREPFGVPEDQRATLLRQRTEVGADQLLAWSNFPAVEGLLATAVEAGASTLRRGALLNQAYRTLQGMTGTRLPEYRERVTTDAEQTETGIGRMLDVLGAPELYLDDLADDDPDRARVEEFLTRLGELETARDGRFAAPASGSARRHGTVVVDGLLAPLRITARERAEAVVDRAMAERTAVDGTAFQAEVFDTAAIRRVTEEATRKLTAYLESQVGVAAEDVVADLDAVAPHAATVKGKAGRGHRKAAYGAVLAPVVTTLIVANLWNPAGWVLAAAGAVTSLAAAPVSRWLRKRAVKKYEMELSRARAQTRKAVNDTFDEVRDGITAWFTVAARTALLGPLSAAVDQAVALRGIAGTALANQERVATTAARVDGWRVGDEDPAAVLRRAMRTYEGAAESTGRALWLGESWCDDPTGLRDDRGRSARVPRRGESVLARLVRERLGAVLAQAVRVPTPGSARYWLAQVGGLLADDPAAVAVLERLDRMLADPHPRVLVYGDYNVGKSSLVRRLLVDEGEPVPALPTVRGLPETHDVTDYPWGRYVLIDTPGLQSGRDEHDDAARRSLPAAALVLYVLGANAVTSDRAGLDLVLRGDPELGVLPKLDRTVFVVNRADELSVDPFGDEAAYERALARREREVREALVATPELRQAGVTVPAERIVFVASDPLNLVGEEPDVTRADFDEYRDWDGVDALRAAFYLHGPALAANGVDVSVLHAGIDALGALTAAAEAVVAHEEKAITQLDRLLGDIGFLVNEAGLIVRDRPLALNRIVLGFVDQVLGEALTIADDQARQQRLEKAVQFWNDADLRQHLAEWAAETEHRVASWVREASILLERRIGSQAFQRALTPSADGRRVAFPEPSTARSDLQGVGSAFRTAVDTVGRLRAIRVAKIGSEQASAMLAAGWFQSMQLSPLNGTLYRLLTMNKARAISTQAAAHSGKIWRTARRANVAIQLVTTAADLVLLTRDLRVDDRRQAEFAAARTSLLQQASEWADDYHRQDPALEVLQEELAAVAALAAKTQAERDARQATADDAAGRCARYEQAIRLGLPALGAADDDDDQGNHHRPGSGSAA